MFTQINKFHELSLCKTHLLEIKSRGIETFFVQTLLAFTKYEDRSLLLPIRAIELRWPPPCYMPPPDFWENLTSGGTSEFNDSDSLLLSLFFFFRIRSFDNFRTNENLDHTEKMPKYDHILSEVDGLHGKGMGSQSKIPRDLTFLPKTKKSILEISVDIIMWSPS